MINEKLSLISVKFHDECLVFTDVWCFIAHFISTDSTRCCREKKLDVLRKYFKTRKFIGKACRDQVCIFLKQYRLHKMIEASLYTLVYNIDIQYTFSFQINIRHFIQEILEFLEWLLI